MLHTSISADTNKNRILVRLVASFPLLFTTSGNVFCSKFSGVWETLWIFKVVRWTRDRCAKINNSPIVSNGVEASSLEIWTANVAQLLTVGNPNKLMEFHLWRSKLEILQSWFAYQLTYQLFCHDSQRGTPKPDIQMRTFLTSDFFFNAFIF